MRVSEEAQAPTLDTAPQGVAEPSPPVAVAPAAPPWNRRAARRLARVSLASVALWIALTTLFRATGPVALWFYFDLPFRVICHQLPERVLTIAGAQMPLCSRCLGIWGGMSIAGALAWPVIPIKALRVVIPVALGLMGLEVLTQDLGWHPVFHPTRILSGLLVSVPFGGALGGLIVRELRDPD
jgi:uncharacterized membrane protein